MSRFMHVHPLITNLTHLLSLSCTLGCLSSQTYPSPALFLHAQPCKLEAVIFGEDALGFAQPKAMTNNSSIAGTLSELLPASYAAVNAHHVSQHVEPADRSQGHSDVARAPCMISGYGNAYGRMPTHAPPMGTAQAMPMSHSHQVCVGQGST